MKSTRLFPVAVVGLCSASALAQWAMDPVWTLLPGDRSYLTSDNNQYQRGIDYNPVTKNLLMVNRSGGLSVVVLDGATGADEGTLGLGSGTITGGTYTGSMIGVADDGAIFMANLTLNATTNPFKVYRWADEGATPSLAFSGDPSPDIASSGSNSKRFGDTLDVRGVGLNTEILVTARGGGEAALLSTADGTSFTGAGVNTDAAVNPADNSSDIGLGVAFGSGDTFWGTAVGRPLRLIDIATGSTTGNFGAASGVPLNLSFITVDPAAGLLAGVELVGSASDRVHLYDISTGIPLWLATETLTANFNNVNGTGSLAFGDGMLFVLDSNNGIQAFQVVPEPGTYALLGLGAIALFAIRRR